MPRLIDADALDDVLREEYLSATDASMVLTPRGSIIFNAVLDRVRCIAISHPPINAEPVRHEGTTTFITTNDLDKYQARIIVDEGKKSKFCRVYYADNPGWDVFDDLTSSYYGKQMYFTQPDGTIYSRLSCGCMTFEEALSEFREAISMDGGADAT